MQRERAGKLTLSEVGRYFHLPIEEAARRMKLCPTVLKKICRRDGMTRWPHRKVCVSRSFFFFSDDDDFLLTSISLNVSCISW